MNRVHYTRNVMRNSQATSLFLSETAPAIRSAEAAAIWTVTAAVWTVTAESIKTAIATEAAVAKTTIAEAALVEENRIVDVGAVGSNRTEEAVCLTVGGGDSVRSVVDESLLRAQAEKSRIGVGTN